MAQQLWEVLLCATPFSTRAKLKTTLKQKDNYLQQLLQVVPECMRRSSSNRNWPSMIGVLPHLMTPESYVWNPDNYFHSVRVKLGKNKVCFVGTEKQLALLPKLVDHGNVPCSGGAVANACGCYNYRP